MAQTKTTKVGGKKLKEAFEHKAVGTEMSVFVFAL